MLAVQRSAGVAPQMNLRNLFHTDEEVSKSTLTLKPRVDVAESGAGISMVRQRGPMSSKKNF